MSKPLKRNRKERRSAVLYKLSSIFKGPGDTLLVDSREHYIEGELEDRIIISVPEMTSLAMVERVQKAAEAALTKPCLVVTHNVEFMRADKLDAREAAQILRKVEHGAEQEQAALERARQEAIESQQAREHTKEEQEAAEDIASLRRELLAETGQAVDGDGDRPGDSQHGDSGTSLDSGGGSAGGAAGPGEDGKGEGEGGDTSAGGG